MTDIQNTSINSQIIETVIGVKTRFKGNVKTDKPIRIDGVFDGEIESTDLVIITKTGSFTGTICCREMQLYGTCTGTATCSQLIDIKAEAVFQGDLTTRNLITVENSVLDGTCKMISIRENK